MDIEKLIEQLNGYFEGKDLKRGVALDAATALSALQAENEKLRAELEQMAACVYYKQGGLCRYGEEDPANVCVFGPCPHQRSAQEVLAELEQVKRCIEIVENQRDSAIKELENYMVQDVLDGNEPCAICAKASDTPCEYCNPKWRGQKED